MSRLAGRSTRRRRPAGYRRRRPGCARPARPAEPVPQRRAAGIRGPASARFRLGGRLPGGPPGRSSRQSVHVGRRADHQEVGLGDKFRRCVGHRDESHLVRIAQACRDVGASTTTASAAPVQASTSRVGSPSVTTSSHAGRRQVLQPGDDRGPGAVVTAELVTDADHHGRHPVRQGWAGQGYPAGRGGAGPRGSSSVRHKDLSTVRSRKWAEHEMHGS